MKGAKWLAEIAPAGLTGGSLSGFHVTLPGGDANNDNSVDVAEFGALAAVYGDACTPGDPNASAADVAADLNCDGSVDVADCGVLISTYGRVGTP